MYIHFEHLIFMYSLLFVIQVNVVMLLVLIVFIMMLLTL